MTRLNLVEPAYFWKLLLGLAVLALSGCIQRSSTSQSQEDCVQPSVPVAFPAYATTGPESNQPITTPIPLPVEWQPQLYPEQLQKWKSLDPVTSLVARSSDEIWLIASHIGDWGSIVRFRPSTREIITYTVPSGDAGEFVPGDLFLSKTDVLWGIGPSSGLVPGRARWFLIRYDLETDSFIQVTDKDGILSGTPYPYSMDDDAHGVLWFVTGNALIRFDPSTQKAERMLDEQRGYTFQYLAVAPDGSIWLSASPVPIEEGKGPYVVIRYNPQTNEIKDYGSPPGAEEYLPLYFDRSGRLWVEDYGWLEFPATGEPEWYQIVRSTVFIYDHAGPLQYGWGRPQRVYESSNGLFWFSSGAGLVRLDLKQGQWCLVTRLAGPFAEDNARNLWTTALGQIYKYRLQP